MHVQINLLCLLTIFSFSGFSLFAQDSDIDLDHLIEQSHCTQTFTVDIGSNHTLTCRMLEVPVKELPLAKPPLSAKLIQSSKAGGEVASAVAIATVSPSVVTQYSRISTTINVLLCNASASLEDIELDWSENPTTLALGNSSLASFNGGLLSNWLLMGGLAALHGAIAYKWTGEKVRFPGLLIQPALFLFSPLAKAGLALARFGDPGEKAIGIISLGVQVVGTGVVTRLFTANKFGAEWSSRGEKWLDLGSLKEDYDGSTKGFVNQFGLLFRDYRGGRHWFMTFELLMSIAAGGIDSFNIEPSDGCSPLITAATCVYWVYATAVVVLYPYDSYFDRAYFGTTSVAQAVSLTIGASKRWQELEDDPESMTEKAAVGIPVALMWANVGRGVFDLGTLLYAGYKVWRKVHRPSIDDINSDDSNGVPLLNIDLSQSPTATSNPLAGGSL